MCADIFNIPKFSPDKLDRLGQALCWAALVPEVNQPAERIPKMPQVVIDAYLTISRLGFNPHGGLEAALDDLQYFVTCTYSCPVTLTVETSWWGYTLRPSFVIEKFDTESRCMDISQRLCSPIHVYGKSEQKRVRKKIWRSVTGGYDVTNGIAYTIRQRRPLISAGERPCLL